MKTKKVKSLQKKLTLRVILIALTILLVAVVSSQLSSSTAFWRATEESVAKSTSIAVRDVKNMFTEAETLLKATANDIKFLPYNDTPSMQAYLLNARKPFSFVSEIYMGIAATNQYADGGGYVQPPEWVLTQRPYYIGAMNTNGIFYQDPYLASTGEVFSSIAIKLNDERGETMGVTVLDLALETLLDICDKATIPGTTAQSFLLDSKMRILAHHNKSFMPSVQAGEAIYVDYNSIGVKATKTIMEGRGDEPKLIRAIDYDGVEKYICTALLPGSGWTFGFAVPVNDFAANLNTASSILMYIIIIIIAIIAIFFASQFLLIKPLKPISYIIDTAKMLAIGKVPDPLNIVTDDELGILADDFNKFIINTQEQVSVLSKMADGDLTTEVTLKSDEDILSKAINRMAENTHELIAEVNETSTQVLNGSRQVADGAQALAQGATEQAATIQELSSSVAEIAERTRENAATADKTAVLSGTIKGNAEKGSHQMTEMITAVNEISEASRNISKIIKTIDDIAFQTNILALNAAVEAARAGEHGKGFAVVAEEVRNLASKSAEAAKDTGEMIQNAMGKAELGSRIASETAESLNEIVSGINESNLFIAEIARSSEEQSLGISQINTGIDQVAQVVQQNSATAEESAAASEEMSSQSDMLQQLIARFKLRKSSGAYKNWLTAERPVQKRLGMPGQGTKYAQIDSSVSYEKY
ncbi:MAG: methyl-accepting chemotaxis protein [Peptococcaceae bacterium]|nr:methyl-accepting chemotaxis protein [Peptococcaceae bacterium]